MSAAESPSPCIHSHSHSPRTLLSASSAPSTCSLSRSIADRPSLKEATLALGKLTSEEFDDKVRPERESRRVLLASSNMLTSRSCKSCSPPTRSNSGVRAKSLGPGRIVRGVLESSMHDLYNFTGRRARRGSESNRIESHPIQSCPAFRHANSHQLDHLPYQLDLLSCCAQRRLVADSGRLPLLGELVPFALAA